jgi:hypothetical protein
MTSTDVLAARSWAGRADSLPPGEPVHSARHGRAAGRRRGCVIKLPREARWGWHPVAWPGLTKVVWAEWIFQTPNVFRAGAASREGGEATPGT